MVNPSIHFSDDHHNCRSLPGGSGCWWLLIGCLVVVPARFRRGGRDSERARAWVSHTPLPRHSVVRALLCDPTCCHVALMYRGAPRWAFLSPGGLRGMCVCAFHRFLTPPHASYISHLPPKEGIAHT